MKKKIVWFAKGGGVAKCGPFKDQISATNAMRLVKKRAETYMSGLTIVHVPEQRKEFPDDVFVWPEETT
jgi:hypothetical protein